MAKSDALSQQALFVDYMSASGKSYGYSLAQLLWNYEVLRLC